MKKINVSPLFIMFPLLVFSSCKKQFDTPPVKMANQGATLSIAALKARFNPYGASKFSGDTNLYCVVIADETSGNLYKEVYVRDATGALHVKLIASGGLFIGDSIRINLNTVLLDSYFDLIQLDSVDISKNVVKLATGLNPAPQLMSISQIIANTLATNSVQSRLVKINGVEFISASQNQPYANASTKATVQYTIQDCNGGALTVRTSGYSYFASENTPSGNGSVVAIVSQYHSIMQLIIRSSAEVSMNGPLCNTISSNPSKKTYLNKDFNDNSVTSGGWHVQSVSGSIGWTTSTKGGAPTPYCQISNYVSGKNLVCETWLLAPTINLSGSSNPILSFKNACNYQGPVLKLYASTNYTGGSPASATWTELPFAASTGNFVFANSGSVSLTDYKSKTTTLAFSYSGSGTDGSTWEVDDINVKDE